MKRSLFPLLSLAVLFGAGSSLAWGQTYIKNETTDGWKLYLSADADFKDGKGTLWVESFQVPPDGKKLDKEKLGLTMAHAEDLPANYWYLLTCDPVIDKNKVAMLNRQLVVDDAKGHAFRFVATMGSDGQIQLTPGKGAVAGGTVTVDKDGNLVIQYSRKRR